MARSLLRWTSLIAGGVGLYVVGVRRLHLHDFNAFLLIVLAVAVVIVGVFAATRGGAPGEHRGDLPDSGPPAMRGPEPPSAGR